MRYSPNKDVCMMGGQINGEAQHNKLPNFCLGNNISNMYAMFDMFMKILIQS